MKAISSCARSVMRALLGLRLRQPQRVGEEAGGGAAVAADLDVVEHRHAVEQRHVLEGAADADLGDGVARHGQDRAALEQDVAVVGHVQARQAIEERGLAGAVGADQAGDLARRDVERHAVERDDAAEAHRHITHTQQRRPRHAGAARDAACATIDGYFLPGDLLVRRADAACPIVGPTPWGILSRPAAAVQRVFLASAALTAGVHSADRRRLLGLCEGLEQDRFRSIRWPQRDAAAEA